MLYLFDCQGRVGIPITIVFYIQGPGRPSEYKGYLPQETRLWYEPTIQVGRRIIELDTRVSKENRHSY